MGEVILDWQDLAERLEKHRERGERIVSTNGVFDLIHVGHVRYLQDARRQGDLLVIGVNSDASTQRLKGPMRPLIPEDERAELLAALACVDYVTLFDEPTPERLLAVIRPHLHAKGGDYDPSKMPETSIVEQGGGKVIALPFTAGRSTTGLVERILAAHKAVDRQ